MRGKLNMSISGLDDGITPIEFNMDNEMEKEFFYKMQEFLLNKGLKLTIYPVKSEKKSQNDNLN